MKNQNEHIERKIYKLLSIFLLVSVFRIVDIIYPIITYINVDQNSKGNWIIEAEDVFTEIQNESIVVRSDITEWVGLFFSIGQTQYNRY